MRLRTRILALLAPLAVGSCCGLPTYTPAFWNSTWTVRWNNNCYNYSNNKRTDTFAQPGRASGSAVTDMHCPAVHAAAAADGIPALPASGACQSSRCKIALVVSPFHDYHWYRLDRNGLWTHKPGHTAATNLDNSNHPITNPETADRGKYTDFCGYFCSCSDSTEGAGHEKIN
jgi:hypothetical protein